MQDRPFSDISYDQFLKEERLMGSRCKACDQLFVPPRPLCVKCNSTDMKWEEMKGEGKLSAFTSISVGPPSMMAEGYTRKNPYISGVVELVEGARVDARIEGLDATRPQEIKVGTPLRVKFIHRGEGPERQTYLGFEAKS